MITTTTTHLLHALHNKKKKNTFTGSTPPPAGLPTRPLIGRSSMVAGTGGAGVVLGKAGRQAWGRAGVGWVGVGVGRVGKGEATGPLPLPPVPVSLLFLPVPPAPPASLVAFSHACSAGKAGRKGGLGWGMWWWGRSRQRRHLLSSQIASSETELN